MRGINENELDLLKHIGRWGSDCYPMMILKTGKSRWAWGGAFGIQGPPTVFKTKRECIASFEAFRQILLDAHAGRI